MREGVDPVGACVGLRGVRIQSIVRDLNDEKIDVIEWNPEPAIFIAKALSPARVSGVYLDDDPVRGKTAMVVVPEDQQGIYQRFQRSCELTRAKTTARVLDLPFLDVTPAVVEPRALAYINRDLAWSLNGIPLKLRGDRLMRARR